MVYLETQIIDNSPKEINLEAHRSCQYCQQWVLKQSIKKCSVCKSHICRQCSGFIDNHAFCPSCLVKMVNEDVTLIMLKPKKDRKQKYPNNI